MWAQTGKISDAPNESRLKPTALCLCHAALSGAQSYRHVLGGKRAGPSSCLIGDLWGMRRGQASNDAMHNCRPTKWDSSPNINENNLSTQLDASE